MHDFLRRNEVALWTLSTPMLIAGIIVGYVTGLRWLVYLFIVLAVVDVVTFSRRVRWVRRRTAPREWD